MMIRLQSGMGAGAGCRGWSFSKLSRLVLQKMRIYNKYMKRDTPVLLDQMPSECMHAAAAVAVSAFQVSFLSPHSISMINELRRETELAGQNQNVSTWHLELEA
eukprot:scaffold21160_cov72-Skeletonema_marinoi.AAC.3